MRSVAQLVAAWLVALAIFGFSYPFIKRKFPSLDDRAAGFVALLFSWVIAAIIAALIYPHGWS